MCQLAKFSTAFAIALFAVASGLTPASAACKKMGFLVNDYGKEGPTKDAQLLLDKHIAAWADEQGINEYSVGKKTVKCELFLDLIVFDEHTCTASATVCWGGSKQPKTQTAKAKKKSTKKAKSKQAKADKKTKAKVVNAAAKKSEVVKTVARKTDETEKTADTTKKTATKVETSAIGRDASPDQPAAKTDAQSPKVPYASDAVVRSTNEASTTDGPTVRVKASPQTAAVSSERAAADRAAAAAERAAAAAERAAAAAQQAAEAAKQAATARSAVVAPVNPTGAP